VQPQASYSMKKEIYIAWVGGGESERDDNANSRFVQLYKHAYKQKFALTIAEASTPYYTVNLAPNTCTNTYGAT
jgi:hypothetical protein